MGLHIIRRGAGYRWRRRVPRGLVGLLGQDHITASLRTTDRPTAQRLERIDRQLNRGIPAGRHS
ncbi:MAG: DUF6538 domain-containing protein [Rhodospirillales bacterium]